MEQEPGGRLSLRDGHRSSREAERRHFEPASGPHGAQEAQGSACKLNAKTKRGDRGWEKRNPGFVRGTAGKSPTREKETCKKPRIWSAVGGMWSGNCSLDQLKKKIGRAGASMTTKQRPLRCFRPNRVSGEAARRREKGSESPTGISERVKRVTEVTSKGDYTWVARAWECY